MYIFFSKRNFLSPWLAVSLGRDACFRSKVILSLLQFSGLVWSVSVCVTKNRSDSIMFFWLNFKDFILWEFPTCMQYRSNFIHFHSLQFLLHLFANLQPFFMSLCKFIKKNKNNKTTFDDLNILWPQYCMFWSLSLPLWLLSLYKVWQCHVNKSGHPFQYNCHHQKGLSLHSQWYFSLENLFHILIAWIKEGSNTLCCGTCWWPLDPCCQILWFRLPWVPLFTRRKFSLDGVELNLKLQIEDAM